MPPISRPRHCAAAALAVAAAGAALAFAPGSPVNAGSDHDSASAQGKAVQLAGSRPAGHGGGRKIR